MIGSIMLLGGVVAIVGGVRAHRREVARRRLGRLARELGVPELVGESDASLVQRIAARATVSFGGRR